MVDFIRDNHFTEMRDTEIMRERLQTMDMIQQYVGEFYSKEWVMKNVLMLDDEEIEKMKEQIQDEMASGEVENPADQTDGEDNGNQ